MSRYSIPSREELLARFDAANRYAIAWLLLEVLAMAALGAGIDWPRVAEQPLITTVAIAAVVGPFVMSLLHGFAEKKVEVRNLKESTRFGPYNKDKLRELFRDTLFRLGLPDEDLPLYITADRTLNAGARYLGLGSLFRSLQGVFLNRQILHRLDPDETQTILGHELGHYYRYMLASERFHIVTLLLGGMLGVFVSQYIRLPFALGILAVFLVPEAFWWATSRVWARNAMLVEFLCDDHGARVHGVTASINTLLKLGADSEMLFALQEQELLNPRYEHLSAIEIARAVEESIPYGDANPQALEEAVRQSLKNRAKANREITVGGFLNYAWTGGEEGDLDELREESEALKSRRRLDWESLRDPRTRRLDEAGIERLVEMLEDNPDALLFRCPDEAGHGDGIHPPLPLRILYLWDNRHAIEQARRELA